MISTVCRAYSKNQMFFVGRANPFICDELNLNGIAAAGFAEELYRMFDSSNISYMLNRVFF